MKIEVFENERAAGYDNFVELWIPAYNFFIEMLPAIIKTESVASKTESINLLVAGCGTGNEIKSIVNAGINCHITGIDPSPEMVAQAHEKLGNRSNVQLQTGLVKDLPENPGFHIATLILVLHFLQDDGDKLKLLKDLRARIVTGGKLILLDIFGDDELITTNLQILGNYLIDKADPEAIRTRIERIKNKIHYIPEKRLIALCLEAGFSKPVRIHQSTIYGGWVISKP
ncbi:MAG: methyltransferase [Bacteroidota bacterium]